MKTMKGALLYITRAGRGSPSLSITFWTSMCPFIPKAKIKNRPYILQPGKGQLMRHMSTSSLCLISALEIKKPNVFKLWAYQYVPEAPAGHERHEASEWRWPSWDDPSPPGCKKWAWQSSPTSPEKRCLVSQVRTREWNIYIFFFMLNYGI